MKRFSILVVEDDDSDYQLIFGALTRFFSEHKIELICSRCVSGEDFLSMDTREIDLVFMDIMLKEKNGMETAKIWRNRDSETGLIFLTNMTQFAIEGYSVRALDYILKPVNYYSLAMKLDRGLKLLQKRMKLAVKNLLWVTQSSMMNRFNATSHSVELNTSWRVAYKTCEGVFGVLSGACLIMYVLSAVLKKEEK